MSENEIVIPDRNVPDHIHLVHDPLDDTGLPDYVAQCNRSYVACAMRTAQTDSVDRQYQHALLGIASELLEIRLAEPKGITEMLKEWGDCVWFVTLFAYANSNFDLKATEYKFYELFEYHADVKENPIALSESIISLLKKSVGYGKELDIDAAWALVNSVVVYLKSFQYELPDFQMDNFDFQENLSEQGQYRFFLHTVLQANIVKLAKRYKDGVWTQAAAINRDTEAEDAAVGTL